MRKCEEVTDVQETHGSLKEGGADGNSEVVRVSGTPWARLGCHPGAKPSCGVWV